MSGGRLTLADARRLRADRARQVADVLRRQVLDGRFDGGALPAEAELVREFGTHLPDETLTSLEGILHTTERPTRGTFHAGRGHDYRTHDVDMHISEIGLCGGHSASGVWVDENARTTVPGLYAAGDLACVPHTYMIGAFVFGDLAGADASANLGERAAPPEEQIRAAHELI